MMNLESKKKNQDLIAGRMELSSELHRNYLTLLPKRVYKGKKATRLLPSVSEDARILLSSKLDVPE